MIDSCQNHNDWQLSELSDWHLSYLLLQSLLQLLFLMGEDDHLLVKVVPQLLCLTLHENHLGGQVTAVTPDLTQ